MLKEVVIGAFYKRSFGVLDRQDLISEVVYISKGFLLAGKERIICTYNTFDNLGYLQTFHSKADLEIFKSTHSHRVKPRKS